MPTPDANPAVLLSKWYLDLVTDAGEAVVLYWARMHYHGLSGAFASMVHRGACGRIRTASSLRAGAPPLAASEITWACAGLGVSAGCWTPIVPAMTHELWRAPDGDGVRWNCVAPAATATLTLDGRELRGLGHVERLDLTVVPWMLPIRELRWGRWISDATASGNAEPPPGDVRASLARSLVWIEWSGDHPLTIIARDGKLVPGSVGDKAITLEDGVSLPLPRDATLREGAIGATALSFIPGVSRVLPPALLSTHEHKWLGRASLQESAAQTLTAGWAIHEQVRFGKSDRACERGGFNHEER